MANFHNASLKLLLYQCNIKKRISIKRYTVLKNNQIKTQVEGTVTQWKFNQRDSTADMNLWKKQISKCENWSLVYAIQRNWEKEWIKRNISLDQVLETLNTSRHMKGECQKEERKRSRQF